MLLFSKTLIVQLKSLDGGIILTDMSKIEFCFILNLSSPDSYLQKIKPSFRVPAAKDIVVKFGLYVSFLNLVPRVLNTYSVCQVLFYIIRIHQ